MFLVPATSTGPKGLAWRVCPRRVVVSVTGRFGRRHMPSAPVVTVNSGVSSTVSSALRR